MRIFLTGATGVIGRRVVPLLVGAGHAVTAVGRSQSKRSMLERQGATAIGVDLFDLHTLRDALAGHDAVVNLATHMPASMTRMMFRRSWRENDRVRREGSAVLMEAALAAGVARFIQESFAPVYEDGGDRWIDETWPLRPVAYNQTVLDAERSATRFTERGGTGVVLRFSGFYGSDSKFLREMVGMIAKGWSPLPGPPTAFVSSISHDDAASAVLAALGVPRGTYNVTDDEPLRHDEWVSSLADALGLARPKPLPRWMTRLGGSLMEIFTRSHRMSNAKLRDATSWTPRWPSVRDGWKAIAPDLRRDL